GAVAGIAEACVDILSDEARHATLARNARERVVRLFSVTREADQVAQVYEEMWAEG
ncbi:MAG: hypothetical protein RIT14_1336, partial [Pseudomonadota bacterium]